MRFVIPVILILVSVIAFIWFTNPTYQELKTIQAEASQYDEALTNSKRLQQERDTLSERYRAFPEESLTRLQSLLPDSADNIRLIIDIQRMAQSYGMTVSSIKFDTSDRTQTASPTGAVTAANPADLAEASRDYGTFRLEFVTTSSYENFLKFTKDIETSLRLTDIEAVDFSAIDSGNYTYTIKLKTYWLKG